MTNDPRRNEWQFIGAVALIALGAALLLQRMDLPWWGVVREAFAFGLRFIWPVAIIALGVLLLISARHGGRPWAQEGQAPAGGHRLYRSRRERMIGGVLGGVGEYLGLDPTWIRIAFVVLSVFSGIWAGVVIYIIGLVLIPEEPLQGSDEQQWSTSADWSASVRWPGRPEAPAPWGPRPGSTETVQTPGVPPAPAPAPSAPAAPTPPAPTPPVPPAPPAPEAPAGPEPSGSPMGWQDAPEPPEHPQA